LFSSLLGGWRGLRANQIFALTDPGLLGTIERLEFLSPLRLVDHHRARLGDAATMDMVFS